MKTRTHPEDFRVAAGKTVKLAKWPTRVEPAYESKDEQRRRFLKRIDDPEKNWKLTVADVEERKAWKRYSRACEECLGATSTRDAPWYVVPADSKKNARLIISAIILDVFHGLKMSYPRPSAERRRQLQLIRARLVE